MSLRRAVFALVAAALIAAIPQITAAAPVGTSPVVSPSGWLPALLEWLGDRVPLSSIVGMDEAGPGLDPDGPPEAVLLDPDDWGTVSAEPPPGPPDGEIGPGLDPNG